MPRRLARDILLAPKGANPCFESSACALNFGRWTVENPADRGKEAIGRERFMQENRAGESRGEFVMIGAETADHGDFLGSPG